MIGIIDIGSNSIRLMIVEGDKTISKELEVARLGEGLAFTGMLKAERMADATAYIKGYVDEAKAKGASDVFVYATEAVRAAANGNDFINMVYNATGIRLEVLPSAVEAKLGFSGAYSGVSPLAVVDIGGASTEITVGDKYGISYSKSLPIGCVRMRDKCEEDDVLLDEYIDTMLERYGEIPKVDKAVFVAGSASIAVTMMLKMDDYDASRTDGYIITKEDLASLMAKIKSTPYEERAVIQGLPASKIDVAYDGMRLITAILDMLGLDSYTFSDKDSLEGYYKLLVKRGDI